MKTLWTKWTAALFALSLLAACGGGGGGGGSTPGGGGGCGGAGDMMTVAVTSHSTTTTTTYNGNLYDPIMTAQTSTINNKTYVDMANGYNLNTHTWAQTLNFTMNGTTAGVYSFATTTAPTGILYSDNTLSGTSYQGTNGAITITSISNIGSQITGTFGATLATDPTHTIGMSGCFNVTRSK